MLVMALGIFLLCLSQAFAQLAPVLPPPGGFAIDGGLRANTPTVPTVVQPWLASNQGDWYPGPGGTGGSVFGVNGLPLNAGTTGRATPDAYNSNDNIFTNGSKFNDYISALRWFTNSAPDKNDINQALYHVSRDAANNQWAFIAGDRLSTSGTSYIDFEFLQGTITKTADGFIGTPLASKPNGGGRTENDMVVSMEYTNGGSKPLVYIYQWKLTGSTWSYQLVTIEHLAVNAFAETNRSGAEINLPYEAFGNSSYPQFAFVEAAVNVTYLLSQTSGGNACAGLSIQTLWIKTKASASSTAALKDFVDPISVNFQFGEANIDALGPFCVSNTTAQALSASPAGGTFSGNGVSNNQFTPSLAGMGTHTITYNFSGCSATRTVTVYGLPTITGTLTVCAGLKTQLSGSASAAAAQPWTSSNTAVATISSTGEVTGISAGTTTITYTNSNACSQTATVTVYGVPSAPAATPTDPTCTVSTGSISITGLSGETYSFDNGAFGATLTFELLAANSSHTIVAKNAAGCTSTTTTVPIGAAPARPTFTVCVVQPTLCSAGSLTINASGGSGFMYTIDGSEPTAANSNNVFNNLGVGSVITVRVKNADLCSAAPVNCADIQSVCTNRIVSRSEVPTAVIVDQGMPTITAYPNPFKEQVRFVVNSPTSGNATLEVYNFMGQRIKTVYQGFVQAGRSNFDLNLHTQKNSSLIYKFRMGEKQVAGKILQMH